MSVEIGVGSNISHERLLAALRKKPEGHELNIVLYDAIRKLLEGKRLNSQEFSEIHTALYKPGPLA